MQKPVTVDELLKLCRCVASILQIPRNYSAQHELKSLGSSWRLGESARVNFELDNRAFACWSEHTEVAAGALVTLVFAVLRSVHHARYCFVKR